MNIHDFGNILIQEDLKRLKKFISLPEDLDIYFDYHSRQYKTCGQLSCKTAHESEYIICKERIGIVSPFRSPSKGGRLWFVVTKGELYIRCLLYLAEEEDFYTSSNNLIILRERLKNQGII